MTALRSMRFEALGGEVELYAIDPAEPLDATAEWIRGLHWRLTRFEPNSELSRFNASAGQWTEVSPELQQLLVASLDAFEKSDGLVNVAILPMLLAAGYDRTFDELAYPSPPEPPEFLHRNAANLHRNAADPQRNGANSQRNAAEMPGSSEGMPQPAGDAPFKVRPLPDLLKVRPLPDLLKVRPGAARLEAGASIDLGGIAKGWIADGAVERLGPSSLVSCSGDLHARGTGEAGDGWPVGFGDRTLLLKDMAAATSGTTKRRWGDGQHHLIDPRTGLPATSDLTEVSVLAPTALEAEVLAKTALLLGSARAEAYLEPRSAGWALK